MNTTHATSTLTSRQDALYALAAAVILPLVDTIVKWLVRDYSVVQVA